MGEALYFGIFIALGGYIARLAKAHPFYKYKTNKLKNKYFSHLYPFMAEKYDETEAYWLTRAITDYVFDFDREVWMFEVLIDLYNNLIITQALIYCNKRQ
jgi:hypothetical protein